MPKASANLNGAPDRDRRPVIPTLRSGLHDETNQLAVGQAAPKIINARFPSGNWNADYTSQGQAFP